MEGVRIISVADLLRQSRPLAGAASLQSLTLSPPPSKKHKPHPPGENPTKPPLPLFPDHNPNPRTLSPVAQPVLLIGTIALPSEDTDRCGGPQNHCLSFSDGSSTVCCAVLDLDVDILGRTLYVLSWNFVPFKHRSGGVLEVIRWYLPPSGELIPSRCPPRESHSGVVHSRTCSGALQVVSPVFRVPCRNTVDAMDSIGFLAEIATCKCGLREQHSHFFAKVVYVYFLGPASCWRPLLSKLIGRLITVSGLKKKQVFVGGEESYLMFVTTATTLVSLCQLPMDVALAERAVSKSKSGGVTYVGIVTGVYMQGMAVELDEKVWLLITHPLLAPQHSLRLGAVISVRNFHFVRPKFSWTRVLLLGTCARTTIDVQSYSVSDTRCHFMTQNQSLLGKFIESLTFSARFWVLLLVACFRRKFAGIFSDKEILGSKSKEGLVQIYASASLPSHVVQHQCGVFKEFCQHDQCTCRNDSSVEPHKLVTPISNFLSKGEAIWMSIISQIQSDAGTIGRNNNANHLYCEGASYCQMIRRIISSEDLGFVLMGTLKISPSSGRLQLVDATGSVDVVIPDLLSNVDGQSIHEVKDYKLVIEGLPTQLVSLGFHCHESLSCKNIFQQFPYKKVLNHIAIYVHYYLRDSTCLDVSSHLPSCKVRIADLRGWSGETFHLLLVTHKFPDNENFQDDPNLSNGPSLFAEALVLPYNLILPEEHECSKLAEIFQGALKARADYVERQQDPESGSSRNSKLQLPSRGSLSGSKYNSKEVERWPSQIPCLLTFGSKNLEKSSLPGYLCHTDGSALESTAYNQWARRILLEFKSDSFCKYQLLHLGAYYILRCSKEGLLCNKQGCENINCDKALINSQTALWSLSFSFGEIIHQREPPLDHTSGVSSARVGETISGNFCQNELMFRQSLSKMHGASDVHLHFPSEAAGPVKEEVEAVEDGLIGLLTATSKVLSVSSCIQMMTELARSVADANPRSNKLPQGNLISLRGNIENIHNYNCKSKSYVFSEPTGINQRNPCSICIHVYDDHHMVRICGDFSKYTYLVGMGAGANATFHRVLMTCSSSRCRKLVLTPVSYVVINSVKESSHQHWEKRSLSPFKYNILKEESFDMDSLALFSQLIQCVDGTLARFHCRVVTINILVLEQDFGKSQSRRQFNMPVVKIPLAGFMLDDGSSLCCCWADAERAESLLRLHETTYRAFFSSNKISKSAGSKRSQDTVGYHLEKILKKHHRVIVRNHGAVTDSSCQDFTFSVGLDEVFSNSEESLLRFIVLNACSGPIFNVAGYTMDSNALEWLDTELVELQVAARSMQNVWVSEVGHVNPLKEARDMLHALVAG